MAEPEHRHARDWRAENWKAAGFGNEAATMALIEYALRGASTIARILEADEGEKSNDDDGSPLGAYVAEGLRGAFIALAEFSSVELSRVRDRAGRELKRKGVRHG